MGVDIRSVKTALMWGSDTRQDEGRTFYIVDRRAIDRADQEGVDIRRHEGVGCVQADDGYVITVTNYGETTRSGKGARRRNRKGRDRVRGNRRGRDTGRRPSVPLREPPAPRPLPTTDHVSRLYNDSQASGEPRPKFSFEQAKDLNWVCVARYRGEEASGIGDTQKEAKQEASRKLSITLRL